MEIKKTCHAPPFSPPLLPPLTLFLAYTSPGPRHPTHHQHTLATFLFLPLPFSLIASCEFLLQGEWLSNE
ncbi:hypothetical protein RIF29_42440 [Crotalaria pallida]|uniref:Uncharacterized protein n=1 Tax=Crotalaria pallida TaxID=3830 RepID=A0AAN9ECN6_CROPI